MFKKLKKDSYEYKGWLQSDHFIKRALAIVGYYFAGIAGVYVAIFLTAVLIVLILNIVSLVWKSVF